MVPGSVPSGDASRAVEGTGGVSDGDLAELLRRLGRHMARHCHHGGRGRHAQARVLDLLRRHGPMRQNDLLSLLDVRSASLSELLAKLERAGFIGRERDERDRRGFVVRAIDGNDAPGTDSAEPNDSFSPVDDSVDMDADVFAVLSGPERDQLRALLLKLMRGLEDDCPCARGPHGRSVSGGCERHRRHCGGGGRGRRAGRDDFPRD